MDSGNEGGGQWEIEVTAGMYWPVPGGCGQDGMCWRRQDVLVRTGMLRLNGDVLAGCGAGVLEGIPGFPEKIVPEIAEFCWPELKNCYLCHPKNERLRALKQLRMRWL